MARWIGTGLVVALGIGVVGGPAEVSVRAQAMREREVTITGPRGRTIDRRFERSEARGSSSARCRSAGRAGQSSAGMQVQRGMPFVGGGGGGGGFGRFAPLTTGLVPARRWFSNATCSSTEAEAATPWAPGCSARPSARERGLLLGRALSTPPAPQPV